MMRIIVEVLVAATMRAFGWCRRWLAESQQKAEDGPGWAAYVLVLCLLFGLGELWSWIWGALGVLGVPAVLAIGLRCGVCNRRDLCTCY